MPAKHSIGSRGTAYRPEIDGVRALAVVAVILFHAGMPWMSGGYAGVDCFFVISGFLITGILLRECEDGAFSLRGFYERRARRILPALAVMLTVTSLAGCLVLFPSDLEVLARSVTWVALFAANVLFWTGRDFNLVNNYFARVLEREPLIHTWSLGVEEQFYVLFPLCLLAAWWWNRKRVGPLLLAATLVSLVLAQWGSTHHPKGAFYLLPFRAWEMLLGAWVAGDAVRRWDLSRSAREALSAVGVALVLFSFIWFDATSGFPGLAALVPTAGTALILAFGRGAVVGRALSWRPLVLIGLMSYSLYLWHQPVFAFARYLSLDEPPQTMAMPMAAALIALTGGLSYLTWAFVERPFRDRRVTSTRMIVIGSAGAGTAAIAFGLWFGFGAAAGRHRGFVPDIGGFRDDPYWHCWSDVDEPDVADAGCRLGAGLSAPPSFAVIGDSHAGHLRPAFEALAQRVQTQGMMFAMGGCPPLTGIPGNIDRPKCTRMQTEVPAFVARRGIRRVFLAARWLSSVDRPDFQTALRRTIDQYSQLGVRVSVIEDVPEQIRVPRRIYWRALLSTAPARSIAELSLTRSQYESEQAPLRAAFGPFRSDTRLQFIDLSDALCDEASCPVGTPAEAYWIDEGHLSAAGARAVGGTLARQAQMP